MSKKKSSRRSFLKNLSIAAAAGSAGLVTGGCVTLERSEEFGLRWEEYFKKHYRLMTQKEKDDTVARLRLQHLALQGLYGLCAGLCAGEQPRPQIADAVHPNL
jgi:hypothetical protein